MPASSSVGVGRRVDPAASAHAEQDALEALWRVVYSTTLNWDKRLRRLNTALCVIAVLNLAVIFWLFQGCWNPQTLQFSLERGCHSYRPSQVLSCGLVAAFIAVLVYYYAEKSAYCAFNFHFPSRWSAFTHSGLLRSFLLEFLATLLQPFPIVHLFVDLNHSQYLVILSLCARLYLLARLLRDWSAAYQKRMFIKQGTRFDTASYSIDYSSVLVGLAYRYTLVLITVGCALNALIMAYLMHLCEREYWLPQNAHGGLLPIRYRDIRDPGSVLYHGVDGSSSGGNNDIIMLYRGETYYQSPYVSMVNAFYFVGVVATTTGLGDIAPVTDQGKMFAVVASIMGILWSSFVVAVLTNKLVPSDFQAYIIDFLHRAEIDREKQTIAATIIQTHWRHVRKYRTLAAQGVVVLPASKAARYTEVMTPLIRKFQNVQRREANQRFIFNEPSITQLDVARQTARHEASAAGTAYGDRPNFAMGSQSHGRSSSDDEKHATSAAEALLRARGAPSASASSGSPLMRTAQSSYGSGDNGESRPLLSEESFSVPIRAPRGTSDETGGVRQKKAEISAKHALKALQFLSTHHHAHTQSLGGGMPSPTMPPPMTRRASFGGPSSYSGPFDAMQQLVASQLAMQAYLTQLESKVDQLLHRAAGESNMLSSGHVLMRWASDGAAAAGTPIFLWHESDFETKHGVLFWTQDPTAVQHRLRVKHAGDSMPLDSISDVFLGKGAEFQSLPCATPPAAQCFTILSSSGHSLHLSSRLKEERDQWVSHLKQLFSRARRPSIVATTAISAGGTPLHSRTHTYADNSPRSPAQNADTRPNVRRISNEERTR